MQRVVKEGQKRDSSNHAQWKAFSIIKKGVEEIEVTRFS